ncbi:MAG: L-histidine N(alpha)-methyltransferase [Nitrosopumilaceae archaeon]|nr:L-histidine N(alpha)-methyltransferase [Nitrosopumilaceae archaeon]NIT99749.1 L-histidine N(alpha)-methyltransferase [Nitrosopumilaceae archaeon]NIU88611.1 L-histidine N(alpha)-methyltransferase [Nitrosopumilaceae archaeon]NIV64885.1 L-histidine N(alpha)-methyltransferase [Nitrosopumilaceae archaeon]NIX60352.1 L-histidine N(alpha)-methyltransferase [Nitrosopumilaceae archaeon]
MRDPIKQNISYKKFVVDERLKYFKPHATKVEKTFAEEICNTLGKKPRSIPPKYFYDKRGSELFDKICKLPEYYLTRTEINILKKIKDSLHDILDSEFRLVELGSGSAEKTRILIDSITHFQSVLEYFPIDVSEILTESSECLLRDYNKLKITGIIDTYEDGLEFIKDFNTKPNLILFLGSSFGNFEPADGKYFLEKINQTMNKDDLFLIGLDLVKQRKILENAYDDSLGITAKFNQNVLWRINEELGGNFILQNFKHVAVYNEKKQRVEMYLKSLKKQKITISKINLSFTLENNELIHTEFSYKYTLNQIDKLIGDTGFRIRKRWTDNNNLFSVNLLGKN